MGKTIIVTAGPTEEALDEVMRITNMSSGHLGSVIAETLDASPEVDKIYYLSPRMALKPRPSSKITYITVRTADKLLHVLTDLLSNDQEPIHAVVHSCAVGDYKGRYGARAEDIAKEAAKRVLNVAYSPATNLANAKTAIHTAILETLKNPTCVQNSSTKISSYEPNLMFMLDLTPKIINCVKETSPDTLLVGFKLLHDVSEEQLIDVAARLREKTRADWIIANDKAKLGDGGVHPAIIIGANGPEGRCETKQDIAEAIRARILGAMPC